MALMRPAAAGREGQRGQILALFALMLFVFVGMVAVVIDVSWLWASGLKVQRASDAAALAGVVHLPGNAAGAYQAAREEATKNGYTGGSGTTVSAQQDSTNARRLVVTINTQVETFFAKLFGINTFQISRTSKAEYALPVPMGSPQNYYGVMVMRTPGSTTTTQVVSSDGSTRLASQGFWGTAISQGADKIDGDPFLAKWDPVSPARNSEYAPADYHNYVVELAPNTVGGSVWIFDAPFCATDGRSGTGDRWLSNMQPVSTFYSLFDTNGTPADFSDDTALAGSGTLFRGVRAADSDLGASVYPLLGADECRAGTTSNSGDPRYWHNRWWPLASGLSAGAAGRTLRVHVTTTDSSSPGDQDATDAHNNFAIEARATVGLTPRVYGLGAMGAYFAVQGGGSSEFFMAQIDAVHAGKTMVIELWDPGDTNNLQGSLQILRPTPLGYQPATFLWRSDLASASNRASACNNQGSWSTTSVTTNSGGTNHFNGCWLTITIPLDATYDAPTPPTVPGPGWWKIRYNMSGLTSQTSNDLTAWRVSLVGSPVHLVP